MADTPQEATTQDTAQDAPQSTQGVTSHQQWCGVDHQPGTHVFFDEDGLMKQCDSSVQRTQEVVSDLPIPGTLPPSQSAPGPMFIEVFYVDTWVDAQVLADHRFTARGKRTFGPIQTYKQALDVVPMMRPDSTHFEVRKVYARLELVKWMKIAQLPFSKVVLGTSDPNYPTAE